LRLILNTQHMLTLISGRPLIGIWIEFITLGGIIRFISFYI